MGVIFMSKKYSYEFKLKTVQEYIYYYNNKRIKRKLSGLSPVEYRKQDTQLAA